MLEKCMGSITKPLVAAIVGLTVAAGAMAADTDKLRWRFPQAFPSTLPGLGDNAQRVADMLNTMSSGDVQFRVFEPGNLVPALELTDAVSNGTIEVGYTWLGYDAGKMPASPLLSARPFGMDPWEFTAWWYYGGGKALGEELLAKRNVHPVLCGITGPETAGWFRKEIKTMEDLKGLKIRFAGLGGQVMQKAGASVTMIPGGEIFAALEKGAIDATEFAMPSVDQKLGFDKVAKFNYFPGWHQTYTAFHVIINKKTWDGLKPATKAMIDTACTAGVLHNLSHGEALQGKVISGFPGKGVQAKRVPTPMLIELNKLTKEVMAEQSAKDADFKKIYDAQEAFSKEYAPWKNLGYMPDSFNTQR